MKLVGGSYRKCIEEDCKALPTVVFHIEGQARHGATYSIKILACPDHKQVAENHRKENYRALLFRVDENPRWLPGAQETELARKRETI